MSDHESTKLSRGTELAMKIVSILERERSGSKATATEEHRHIEDKATGFEHDPVEPVAADLEPQHLIGVRLISRRDEIPISEKHVLVMWGLSTYRFEHPLGVTFAVDNSQSNGARDKQHREAQLAAMELARAKGLQFIYVLR
jgi:hypothetical protein